MRHHPRQPLGKPRKAAAEWLYAPPPPAPLGKARKAASSVSNQAVQFFRHSIFPRHSGASRNLRPAMDSGFRRNDGSTPKPPESKHYRRRRRPAAFPIRRFNSPHHSNFPVIPTSPSFQLPRHSNFPVIPTFPSFQFSPVIPAKAGIYACRLHHRSRGCTAPESGTSRNNGCMGAENGENRRRTAVNPNMTTPPNFPAPEAGPNPGLPPGLPLAPPIRPTPAIAG